MVKAVIFDFNGTLYDDTDIHMMIWRDIYKNISGGKNNFDEVFAKCFGATNYEIIELFYRENGKYISKEDAIKESREKERRYREYSIEHDRCHLVKGAKELFEYLISNGYKINIASASIEDNMNFFFKEFNLSRWFDRNLVTYDDGVNKNKFEMYVKAAKNIGVEMSEVLVFEDSLYGSMHAHDAGCENIVLIDMIGDRKLPEYIHTKIKDFTEFDIEKLNN